MVPAKLLNTRFKMAKKKLKFFYARQIGKTNWKLGARTGERGLEEKVFEEKKILNF